MANNPAVLSRTETQLEFAGIESFGIATQIRTRTLWLGESPVDIIAYREAVPGALDEAKQVLAQATHPIIVLAAWDESKKTIDDERRAGVAALVQAGADLVIGQGLDLGKTAEQEGEATVYYSLGSVWRDFEQGQPGRSGAIALDIAAAGDHLTVGEVALSFTRDSGFRITP